MAQFAQLGAKTKISELALKFDFLDFTKVSELVTQWSIGIWTYKELDFKLKKYLILKSVSDISISVGAKNTFGRWQLFITTNGMTTPINISEKTAKELITNGV